MNSNPGHHENDQQLRELLKRSFPSANTELARDLWPQMLQNLSGPSVSAPWHAHVPWFDWALAALAAAALLIFPAIIPALFYHF
jgi:hypothetical protein